MNFKPEFYGSVTVGERGQVVIPADARQSLAIESGEKLLAFRSPHSDMLMLVKASKFQQQLSTMVKHMQDFESKINETKGEKNA